MALRSETDRELASFGINVPNTPISNAFELLSRRQKRTAEALTDSIFEKFLRAADECGLDCTRVEIGSGSKSVPETDVSQWNSTVVLDLVGQKGFARFTVNAKVCLDADSMRRLTPFTADNVLLTATDILSLPYRVEAKMVCSSAPNQPTVAESAKSRANSDEVVSTLELSMLRETLAALDGPIDMEIFDDKIDKARQSVLQAFGGIHKKPEVH